MDNIVVKILSTDNMFSEVLVEIYGFRHRRTRVFIAEVVDNVGIEKLVAPKTLVHVDMVSGRKYIVTRNKRWLNSIKEKVKIKALNVEEIVEVIKDINPKLIP